MDWFKGGIEEAIDYLKRNNSIFVVYIEGKDDKSKMFSEFINSSEVSNVLNSSDFTAIKIEENTFEYQQFSEIYNNAPIPSIYFLGSKGTLYELIKDISDTPSLMKKINDVLIKAGKEPKNFASTEHPSLLNKSNEDEKDDTNSKQTLEEKARHAQELLEIARKKKEMEEKEKEKQKEIERRKIGQDVQKLRKWQQEQELKELLQAREKEKKEEQLARKRVLDQIAQDKADRAAKFNQNIPRTSSPSPATTSATSNQRTNQSNVAKLQFKLPDGSTRLNEFSNGSSLQEVRNYVSQTLGFAANGFVLSTTFPKRTFTNDDNSKTMSELGLVPNAVMLILPLHHGSVSTTSSNLFVSMFWTIITPFLSVLTYLKSFIFGTSEARGANLTNTQDRKRTGDTSKDTPKPLKRRLGETTTIQRQGNIHRLTDKKDSDDENNTWNGNSTQQM